MTSETFNIKQNRVTRLVILAFAMLFFNSSYSTVHAQNSTSSNTAEDSTSCSCQNNLDFNATSSNPSDSQESNQNSTSTNKQQNNANYSQSNSTQETNQTSTTISDQMPSNTTDSEADWNATETKNYQNSTSTERQSTSTNAQSTNSSGNATETEPDNTMNGNATINSNQNSTDTAPAGKQNDTSSVAEQQANSTNLQSANSTDTGNTTETTSQNSTSYSNSTQVQGANENATSIANESMNLTDSVAVNPTAALPLPDFDISIDPFAASIDAGSSASYSITIGSINGFDADVSLTIESRPIAGISASLSSNMTRPSPNSSTTSLLSVQTDPSLESGKYKLKVTASSANMSDSSISMTLEVTGKNVTLDWMEQFDPIAMKPIMIKDMQDNIIDDIFSNRMVLISTNVINNYNKTQPFIIVIEVRDEIGTTLYLQLQKGVLNSLGEVEVAISWVPNEAGIYQVRTFAIDEIKEDPEPLSAPVGKIIEVK